MSTLGIGPSIKPLTKRKFNKLLFSPPLYALMGFSALQWYVYQVKQEGENSQGA